MNLKAIRESKGYTQEQVAKWLGKDKRDISKIERGVFFPTKNDFDILIKNFDCKPCDLLNVEDCFVATSKILVATKPKTKSRVNTYNYHVRVDKAQFPLLEKNKLKELGFKTNADFLLWAYKKLQKKSQAVKLSS